LPQSQFGFFLLPPDFRRALYPGLAAGAGFAGRDLPFEEFIARIFSIFSFPLT
jgi:hypothetical protein